MNKKQELIKLLYEIDRFVKKQNSEDSDYSRASKSILRDVRKFSPNVSINLKEVFENEWYSIEGEYDRMLRQQAEGKNISLHMQAEIEKAIDRLFLVNKDTKLFYNELIEMFGWARDTITDWFLWLEAYQKYVKGEEDTIVLKMFFKEMYSMIDRLRSEASLIISDKSMNIHNNDLKQIKSQSAYKEKMSQDLLFNTYFRFLSKNNPYITKWELSEDNWVTFEFDDLDSLLSKYDNKLYYYITEARNNFEHTWPTLFRQYYSRGSLTSTSTNKMNDMMKKNIYLAIIILFYHLRKLDSFLKENGSFQD